MVQHLLVTEAVAVVLVQDTTLAKVEVAMVEPAVVVGARFLINLVAVISLGVATVGLAAAAVAEHMLIKLLVGMVDMVAVAAHLNQQTQIIPGTAAALSFLSTHKE
jgi:hypothetical protein